MFRGLGMGLVLVFCKSKVVCASFRICTYRWNAICAVQYWRANIELQAYSQVYSIYKRRGQRGVRRNRCILTQLTPSAKFGPSLQIIFPTPYVSVDSEPYGLLVRLPRLQSHFNIKGQASHVLHPRRSRRFNETGTCVFPRRK